jgi:hypothetical protein
MSIGFHVGNKYFEIGSGDFFHAFFSTIAVHLEDEKWGSNFPTLMNDLYSGELDCRKAQTAANELAIVRKRLEKFPPNEVVWDFRNRKARPPWGDTISDQITSLSNYFVTSDGKDLMEVMFTVFDTADKTKKNIVIT